MALFFWSKTPANNGTADPTINFAPQMAPSAVGPSGRALMTAIANWRDDISGATVTTGTSTAYAVSTNSNFNQGNTPADNLAGQFVAFTPHVTNSAGPVTLSVDGLGPYALRSAPNAELPAGVIIQGTPYVATFNQTDGALYLQGFFGNPYNVPLGASLEYWLPTAPNSSFAFPYGQAISRTTYSALFALMGTTYGAGDGSTTFNLPDKRGRVSIAADNMGGTAANRVTTAGGGINGSSLGASGGNQNYTQQRSDLPNVSPKFTGSSSAVSGATTGGVVTGSNLVGGISGGAGNAEAPQNASLSAVGVSGTVTPQGTVESLNGGVTQTAMEILPPAIVCNTILRII